MSFNESDVQRVLADDPGNPLFADYADLLRVRGEYLGAIDMCLAGLSANPDCNKGRLVLARLYYERSYLPFAVAELQELLRRVPESQTVTKLLQKLAPGIRLPSEEAAPKIDASTVAETTFDFSELDLIEEADRQNKGKK